MEHVDDYEIVICADEGGGWDNIQRISKIGETHAIIFGGGSPFKSDT